MPVPKEILLLQFNSELTILIKNNNAMVVCDVSVKNRRMGGYWIIVIRDRWVLMEKEIYLKNWHINTLKSAEAIIILDLMQVIH